MSCCKALNEISEKYNWPIYRPLILDGNHNIKEGNWSIKLFHSTPSGRISTKSTPSVVMNYCPFCGAQLREETS